MAVSRTKRDDLDREGWTRALQRYLEERFGPGVRVRDVSRLGKDAGEKGFGYGAPMRVSLEGAPVAELVVHVAGTGGFGHDTLADRAVEAIVPYETFNHLPRHVRALDLAAITEDGAIHSLGNVRDFLFVTEYAEGRPYFLDLERIAQSGRLEAEDLARVEDLARYLARVHADRSTQKELWLHRVRDLFGHHECIAGLIDSYDAFETEGFVGRHTLVDIERRLVPWRHRLKQMPHRLCRVHGDFHPWNILFDHDGRLVLLDRSRGEWGEAADDVAALSINFLFFSLRRDGRLSPPFEPMWDAFYASYLDASGDRELLRVIAPYLVWRALVVASPAWYPRIGVEVRRSLFRFIDRVLDVARFDPAEAKALLEAPP